MAQNAGSSKLSSGSSFLEFNTQVQTAALNATRSAAGLPADIQFHRSIDSSLADDLDAFSARVLHLTNNLLSLVSTADSSRRKGKGKLQSQDDVVDDFHSLLVDPIDQLLERTDTCLDEFLGRNKAPQVAINPNAVRKAASTNKHATPSGGKLDAAVQHAAHLAKPQLSFKTQIDNTNDTPWYPVLSHKFNAQVPLGHVFRDADADYIVRHPYRYEITHIQYPQRMFVSAEPIPPTPFESTSAVWVSTPDTLEAMLDDLRKAQEIAIDLEHNNYRSFAGIVCLMQVSTRTNDWIVDTLALRDELATGALNEVFTDPKIVKVFHGAESDIVWLQQDFNLYIVNLFDTFHASKLLEFPRHGLANLLEMYCDFVPDKRYQLADWRIRPLPEEMLSYARSDTHFLLFIYDNLRNALLDRALSAKSRSPSPSASTTPVPTGNWPPEQRFIRQSLTRSEETALRTYEKELYDVQGGSGPGGWDALAKKWNKGGLVAAAETSTGKETLPRAVYRCVHHWRDTVAREEDESTRYVLPNHFLFQIAERPPADMAALLKNFTSVPPVVRKRAKELLAAIRGCVTANLTTPAAPPPKPVAVPLAEKEVTMEVEADVPMLASSNLWTPKSAAVWSTGNSSLFGASLSSKAAKGISSSSRTTSSTLFGGKRASKVLTTGFQEVLTRIHSALVVIPSMPSATPTTAATATTMDDASEPEEAMPLEIPYVPAAHRTTKPAAEVVDDSIVVVGQARTKKRKRAKTDDAETAEESKPRASKKSSPTPQAEEGFDFSSVPNILDDVPNDEETRAKKKKKGKKDRGEAKPMYGDFPAPPPGVSGGEERKPVAYFQVALRRRVNMMARVE
ncbi:Exosome complex exonuclease RRP6 [Mycena kentingensis (nom. inval.)]|nr:Exosome complex exonuclease RRP6 [Mycena kentingensis (nom. inval.)]